jgi:probable HAF family extracellular repeat protein
VLPGASRSQAVAISDGGVIVGRSDGGADSHATVWLSGKPLDIGALLGSTSSGATDVNNRGQVTGLAQWGSHSRAFVWEPGRIVDVGALPGDEESVGVAINDSGQVVGISSDTEKGTVRGFLWDKGVMQELGVLPGSGISYPTTIGSHGVAAGLAIDFTVRPILFSRDGIALLPSVPGSVASFVYGMNQRGDVVGNSFDGNHSIGVIWMRRP